MHESIDTDLKLTGFTKDPGDAGETFQGLSGKTVAADVGPFAELYADPESEHGPTAILTVCPGEDDCREFHYQGELDAGKLKELALAVKSRGESIKDIDPTGDDIVTVSSLDALLKLVRDTRPVDQVTYTGEAKLIVDKLVEADPDETPDARLAAVVRKLVKLDDISEGLDPTLVDLLADVNSDEPGLVTPAEILALSGNPEAAHLAADMKAAGVDYLYVL